MMPSADVLPESLRSFVAAFVARRRRIALYRAAGLAVAFALAWLLLTCLLDRWSHLPAAARVAMLGLNAVGVAIILARPVREALRPRVNFVEAAADIERHSPRFGQRLQTVTSQLMEKPEHRGSPQLLAAIFDDVDRDVRAESPARLLPYRAIARAWAIALSLLLVIGALAPLPWLDLPRLMARAVRPLARIRPVTTTRLDVSPGTVSVTQGRPLNVSVRAQRIGDEPPVLCYSADGKNWSREPMAPSSSDAFAFTISTIDHDLKYYVTGGDAETDHYDVRALRRPAVAAFRIRYTYPAYTGKPALTVSNTDGVIEAPVGSDAAVAVTSTEPLGAATLAIAGRKVEMQPTVEPTVREAKVKVDRDAPVSLEMTSTRGVAGTGPPTMALRAVPDLPPMVRLIQPAQDLRLTPRDIVHLQYLATDDYGVTSLLVREQTNLSAVHDLPVPTRGDRRYLEGIFALDLARFDLRVGDLVRFKLVARDGAGHEQSSEERFVQISPRAIDVNDHLRLAELHNAVLLADALAQDFDGAARKLQDARNAAGGKDSHDVAAITAVRKRLSAASDDAASLKESLLRTTVHSDSPDLCTALAAWCDDAQRTTSAVDRATAYLDTVAQGTLPEALGRSAQDAKRLHDQLQVIVNGEVAAAVLAEREDAAAETGGDRPAELVERSEQDIRSGASELALNADAGDFAQQLQAKIEQARQLEKEQRPVDFAQLAAAWADDLTKPVRQVLDVPSRFAIAAQAEALRPDAALVRARDLQLAGHVADVLESQPPAKPNDPLPKDDPRAQYPGAIAALQAEHVLARSGEAGRKPEEVAAIHAAAGDARKKLLAWAGAGEEPADPLAAETLAAEELALEANAAAARKEYDQAAAADKRLADAMEALDSSSLAAAPTTVASADEAGTFAQELSNSLASGGSTSARLRSGRALARQQMKVATEMDAAKKLEQIQAEQERLRQQTDAAQADPASAPPGAVPDLAQRQKAVADAVKSVHHETQQVESDEDPDPLAADGGNRPDAANPDDDNPAGRENAIAAIQAAQERLAAMPQQLTDAQQAAESRREAKAQSAKADADAAARQSDPHATDPAKDAAGRVAEQAQQDLADATARLDAAARSVDPDASEALSQKLSGFGPETSAATAVIDRKLTPALRELRQAAAADDGGGVSRATASARAAIDEVQGELRGAQDALVERDPLVAAKWFAQAAAQDLSQQKADLARAGRNQRRTSTALAKAWDRSVHNAAAGRLGMLPRFSPLLRLYSDELAGIGSSSLLPRVAGLSGVWDWGRPRAKDPAAADKLSAAMREADPPGYEDSLKAYFEVLGQARAEGEKK